jgi:hypothetical protein
MEGHASSPPRVSAWLPDLGVGIEEAEFKSSWGNVGMPLVNLLEIELPNFDRPGYKKVYLDWLLYRRPLFLFQKLGQALVETSKAMWEWMATSPGQAVQACHEVRRRAYARLTGMSLDCVEKLDETRWVRNWRKPGYVFSVGRRAIAAAAAVLIALVVLVVQFGFLRRGPYAQGQLVIWDYVRSGITSLVLGAISYWGMTLLAGWLNLGEDYLLEPAQRVEGILDEDGHGVPYILFGHDHAHNAQQLPLGGWYLNTGTWMHMYETQRKRLLRAEHEYPFVRMMDTHHVLDQSAHNARPRVELLRWNDKARRVEPCETFRGADEAGSKERREGTVQTIP